MESVINQIKRNKIKLRSFKSHTEIIIIKEKGIRCSRGNDDNQIKAYEITSPRPGHRTIRPTTIYRLMSGLLQASYAMAARLYSVCTCSVCVCVCLHETEYVRVSCGKPWQRGAECLGSCH